MGNSKILLFSLTVVLLMQKHCLFGFLIERKNPECINSDNETYVTVDKCSWMSKYERNLGKYRNFYAKLLEEDNQKYNVEIQELYNTVASALAETNLIKKQRMFYYSIWLIEKTEDLEGFLLTKGLRNVVKNID